MRAVSPVTHGGNHGRSHRRGNPNALRVRQSPTEGNPPAALVSPDAIDGKPVYGTKCHAARTALAPQRTASPRRATAAGGFPSIGIWRPRWLTYDL
ncbi:hypothetical protein HW132_19310 [Brasilonema sp. CT11]|nr:hypothetical protein [Brasilonema sp. CT11]